MQQAKIRVAILSFWHVHAQDYAQQAAEHPDTEIVAIWDDVPERGRLASQQWGCTYEESLSTLLARQDIDAVVVSTPTSQHRDVITAAARAGKHVFTEKVLASTQNEANEILAAIAKSGVKLTISLPRLNNGSTQVIQKILADGQLGDLTQVRCRLSHSGALSSVESPSGWLPERFYNLEQSAGGAMIDLGCHPMYLTRLFLGMPQSVTARYGYVTGREVEDNAVAVLSYPNGALGIVETGFASRCSPFTIELHGTEGSLLYGMPEGEFRLRSSRVPGAGDQWISIDDQPALPSSFHQWVGHIQNGTTATANIQIALDLTLLMEAANRSAHSGQTITLL